MEFDATHKCTKCGLLADVQEPDNEPLEETERACPLPWCDGKLVPVTKEKAVRDRAEAPKHDCNSCPHAGHCSLETIIRFLNDQPEEKERLEETMAGISRLTLLQMLIDSRSDPLKVVRNAIAMGYVLGKGARLYEATPSLEDYLDTITRKPDEKR